MAQPYDPDKHPTPPWTWHDDTHVGTGAGYWQLDDSIGGNGDPTGLRNYECVQYTFAKIHGRRPYRDDPHQAENAAEVFGALGYRPSDCGNCGCGDGKCKDSIVIYSTSLGSHHVAAFDRVLCDWGGKLRGPDVIVRFKRPQDFMQSQDTMVCYCRRLETPPPYIADPDLRAGFIDPPAVAPRALGPTLSALLMALWRAIVDAVRRALGGGPR